MELIPGRKRKNNGGFTLLETLIAVAIVGLIAAVGVSVFAFGPRSFSNQVNSLSNQYRVRDVARNISRDTRMADPDLVIAGQEALQIGEISYTFSNGSVFRDGAELASGIAIFEYALNDGRLSVMITSTDNGGESFSLSLDIYVRSLE